MLVLTMKPGKEGRVIVGDEIEIELIQIRANQVKLGFTAPKHVSVDRLKVWKSKRDQRWKEKR